MPITRTLSVPDHVRDIILNQMEWVEVEGKTVGRITSQLERQTYVDVNKVLGKLGGKWNRAEKFAGHVFDEDPRSALREVENEGKLTLEMYGFFETPPHVIKQMLNLTDPKPREWVLEPSAGGGAILDALTERTGDRHRVHAVELHEGRAKALAQAGWHTFACDFLEFDGEEGYDVVLMNPPFENGQDQKHILHAYHNCLKPGGRMAAIASAGIMFRTDRQELQDLIAQQGLVRELPSGTFDNTGVNSVLICLTKPKNTRGAEAESIAPSKKTQLELW